MTYISGNKLLGTEVTLKPIRSSDHVSVGAHLMLVQHELARVVILASVATKPTSGKLEKIESQLFLKLEIKNISFFTFGRIIESNLIRRFL